jgi:flagellar protein FliS
MSGTGVGSYQAVEALTGDPGRLVLMLFDGATRLLRQGQRAAERRDFPRFSESVSRAHAIIAELATVLDREAGGEVGANLARLYDFMLRRLAHALASMNPMEVEEVLAPLQTLREGFEAAAEMTKGTELAKPEAATTTADA